MAVACPTCHGDGSVPVAGYSVSPYSGVHVVDPQETTDETCPDCGGTGEAPSCLPAVAPCRSCPYRRDVPSGVWSEDEYAKLPPYDGETWAQPVGVFYCHQQDGRVCAGWAGCHDMDESMALRLAAASGRISEEDVEAILDYESSVPLFASGREAADHGLAEVERPGADAVRTIQRLERKLGD